MISNFFILKDLQIDKYRLNWSFYTLTIGHCISDEKFETFLIFLIKHNSWPNALH